ncbi:MAG TPA: hypothetical protein VH306_07665 [Gaiellaceae bacterium]
MVRLIRSAIALVDRYVTLAGRNCCPGRSWVKLDKSIERRAQDQS